MESTLILNELIVAAAPAFAKLESNHVRFFAPHLLEIIQIGELSLGRESASSVALGGRVACVHGDGLPRPSPSEMFCCAPRRMRATYPAAPPSSQNGYM